MSSKRRRSEPRVRRPEQVENPVSVPVPVSIAFFLSGAAGLIFQIVWLYRCGLVFGNSLWATSVVLSSFMAGLALGSALAASFVGGIRRLLLAYSALELAVAATGIALTYSLPATAGFLAHATTRIIDNVWLVNLIRLGTAFALLVVPATAMGATLPVLVGAWSRQQHGFGRVLGRLYGWNTIGAVLGVLGAELVLIGRYGVLGTAWVAALLDVCAAALVFRVARGLRDHDVLADPAHRRAAPGPETWRLLVCAFLAGGTFMALEVVWFRFLTLFVMSTTLAASVMLAVVLAAIGIGALLGSVWLERNSGAVDWLPAACVATTCLSAVTYVTFQTLTDGSQVSAWYRVLWFACALTFPTALLSGLIFTLIGEALKRAVDLNTRAAGWLTLANTTGAMFGPLVAAFVLLPGLGMERSLFGLALVYALIGVLASPGSFLPRRASAAPGRALAAASAMAAAVLLFFPFGLMATGYFVRAARPYAAEGERIVATREGATATIFLMQQTRMGGPLYHRLVTNGFSMTGTSLAAQRYMRYFAYWPLVVHEAPIRRALLICYGMGVTLGAITDADSVESIDVVEISPDIVAISDAVYSSSQHPLHDPRVRLHLDDGRYFLQTTEERFDLITGEPPPPLTPGTVSLYTREYFQLMHDRLSDGGIATYWLPVARNAGTDMVAIIRGFCDVFADCSLWNGTPADLMLVGIRGGARRIPAQQVAKPWTQSVLGSRLREVGFELPEQIGATFVADADSLARLATGTLPLTDDFPQRVWLPRARLDAGSPSAVLDRGGAAFEQVWIDPIQARAAFEESALIRRVWPEALRQQTLPFFEVQRGINEVLRDGANPLRQIEALHLSLTQTSLQTLPAWILGLGNLPFRDEGIAMADDRSGRAEYFKGLSALIGRDYSTAVSFLAEAEKRGLVSARTLLAYSLCLAGRVDEARSIAALSRSQNPDIREFWSWLENKFSPRGGKPSAP